MFTFQNLQIIIALVVFALLIWALAALRRKLNAGFSAVVAIALVAGIAYGIVVQALFGVPLSDGSGVSAGIREWVNLIGVGFIHVLQLVIVPLVTVSIITAITKTTGSAQGARKTGKIIGVLLATTVISAVLSIIVTAVFGLSADKLIEYSASSRQPASVSGAILDLIPSNLFAALAGGSVLPVVFIAALIGMAYISVKKIAPDSALKFESFLHTAYEFVMKVVEFVIDFTPYGVLAIMSSRIIAGNWQVVAQLGIITGGIFAALILVFISHLVIFALFGLNPIRFVKTSSAALLFAFSSRSSAATMPLTIKAQTALGVSEANANLAASLGTCVGQNGCAGVFVTMLAILVGLVQGWNVWSAAFLIPLVLYVVIGSIGTAGVGGGATNVSLFVLSLMGLPIELVAVLIAVDFIVDMGRTALNVSDSILAGYVAGKWEHEIVSSE
ncbi:MAG: cation:dicarboxylase symporter family transporter [Spirochaetaceae bacterium]|jgi:L-cystine uptake protein TcyP (sodium:dicarboxylate symporter family)|nr:cation:dicarboxylase symporter family transporter [Spirochaetaceae bacterium]